MRRVLRRALGSRVAARPAPSQGLDAPAAGTSTANQVSKMLRDLYELGWLAVGTETNLDHGRSPILRDPKPRADSC